MKQALHFTYHRRLRINLAGYTQVSVVFPLHHQSAEGDRIDLIVFLTHRDRHELFHVFQVRVSTNQRDQR